MLLEVRTNKADVLNNNGMKNINGFSVYFKGYFFIGDTFYENTDAINYIIAHLSSVNEQIKHLNGMFVCLIIDDSTKQVKIFNDKLCAQQIFYTESKDVLYFADDFFLLQKHCQLTEFDELSVIEFMTYRFVSGKFTLIKNIFEIEACSIYTIDYKNTPTFERIEWYKYKVNFSINAGGGQSEKNIYQTMDAIFNRLKKSLGIEKYP
jgi:asparagine synthetase B (glutamine-hydrolysing)